MAVWKGSTGIQEQPGSPHETITASSWTMVRTFRGPYAALQSARPKAGDTMEDISNDLFVDRIELVREAGTSGRMVVYLNKLSGSVGSGEPAPPPRYEVEWVQIEKPLSAAPYFASGGAAALTDEDRDKIEEWRAATSAADRTTLYNGLSANAKLFVNRLRAGIEAFFVPAPVARITSWSWQKPSTSACGKRQSPPGFSGLPSGYSWLKTADRAVREGASGRWERIEEWTGADFWDPQLYPLA